MILLQEVSFDFSLIDESGVMVAIVGYLIVFTALIMLFLVFSNLPKLLKVKFKRNKESVSTAKEGLMKEEITGEVNAAIGTALHMFFNEQHDEEHLVLTINKVSKSYSPWSSKIYGVTRNLNRRF